MAKVINPLGGSDARGHIGRRFIFRRGGIATKYFVPRDPRTPAQLAARQAFKELVMSYLTREQADLIYSLITHDHDEFYSPLSHGHDHGGLSGLADDDHTQYYNQTRGDARYSRLGHTHSYLMQYPMHGLAQPVPASSSRWLCPFYYGVQATAYAAVVPGAGVLKSLRCSINSAQPGTGSLVCTLQVNGSNSALVVTMAASAAAGEYTDLTHTVNVSGGETLIVAAVNNATGNSGNLTRAQFLWQGSTI